MKGEPMRLKKEILRKICGFLAVLVLVASTAWPVTVEAARLPYFIKINRQQNVVTIYKLDSRGAYTVPVKAMTCSTGVNNSTPTGTFTMSGKYRWHELMGEVYGQYCSRIHGGVLSILFFTMSRQTRPHLPIIPITGLGHRHRTVVFG